MDMGAWTMMDKHVEEKSAQSTKLRPSTFSAWDETHPQAESLVRGFGGWHGPARTNLGHDHVEPVFGSCGPWLVWPMAFEQNCFSSVQQKFFSVIH